MKLPRLPVLLTVLVAATGSLPGLFGCSSSPLSGVPDSERGVEPAAVPTGSAGAGVSAGTGGSAGSVSASPTSTWAPYPAGPYGTGRGATIENLSFLGWRHPELAGYDPAKFETVRLSDFYDPDGHTGVKLLAINASAVWCSVCRAEYADMNTAQVYSTLRPMGLEILGTLFEDNAYYPAQAQDLTTWGLLKSHAVKFPLAMDPGFKLGKYFDSDATPLNMLIDVRTMTIAQITMGYSPTYWTQAQALLQKL